MRNSLIQKEMISAGQQNDLVMKFKVTIIETLKMTVDVETENQEQAEQIVDSNGGEASTFLMQIILWA